MISYIGLYERNSRRKSKKCFKFSLKLGLQNLSTICYLFAYREYVLDEGGAMLF